MAGEDRACRQGESGRVQGRHHRRRVPEGAEARAGVCQGVREPKGVLRADAGARRQGAVRHELHDRAQRRLDEANRQAGHGQVRRATDKGDVVSALRRLQGARRGSLLALRVAPSRGHLVGRRFPHGVSLAGGLRLLLRRLHRKVQRRLRHVIRACPADQGNSSRRDAPRRQADPPGVARLQPAGVDRPREDIGRRGAQGRSGRRHRVHGHRSGGGGHALRYARLQGVDAARSQPRGQGVVPSRERGVHRLASGGYILQEPRDRAAVRRERGGWRGQLDGGRDRPVQPAREIHAAHVP